VPEPESVAPWEEEHMTLKRHESKGILSKAVEANGFVYTAGITADTPSKDIKGQTKEILDTIDRLLAGCGTDKSKVLSAMIWVTDIRNRDAMNEVYNAWTGGNDLPARACVEARLADPRLLVEIAVVAVK
jgi:enamine deaminase RidA (YjgF/YER057c/UK114 family)